MMRIDIRDRGRFFLGRAKVSLSDPVDEVVVDRSGQRVGLQWDETIVHDSVLCGCPVCGCREIFQRNDFPQRFGLGLVMVAGLLSIVLFWWHYVVLSVVVLFSAVVIDRIASFCTGACLVCYRCRSEFRGMDIHESHEEWDLAIGEKYRPIRQVESREGERETGVESGGG